MNQVILLTTRWSRNYWESTQDAPYKWDVINNGLSNLTDLAKSFPLPALGIYGKGKQEDYSDRNFVYIRIQGITADDKPANGLFHSEPVKPSSTSSNVLRSKLPDRRLVAVIETDTLLKILNEIGEQPPTQWLQMVTREVVSIKTPSWRDYLGHYFLELESGNMGDNEFEDRIARLLTALGFKVTQKEHSIQGACADGIALHEDIGIVYDCKNTQSYTPTESDVRALKQYTNDEMTLHSEKTLYSAFISRDFQSPPRQDTFHLRVEPLLYLLWVKLVKGSEFNLNPHKLILQKRRELNRETIDEYWRP